MDGSSDMARMTAQRLIGGSWASALLLVLGVSSVD